MPCASRFLKVVSGFQRLPSSGQTYSRCPEHNRHRMTALRRLGVVMDPIGASSYAKDSTLAMLLAAEARGFAVAYLEQRDLLLRDGVAFGRMRAVTVRPDPAGWFTLGEPAIEPLSTLECILMRKDPPFDTEYIYSTYILERAEAQGVLIVNRPRGLRDMNEKVYTTRSEEHTSELQSHLNLVCRLLLEKKKNSTR